MCWPPLHQVDGSRFPFLAPPAGTQRAGRPPRLLAPVARRPLGRRAARHGRGRVRVADRAPARPTTDGAVVGRLALRQRHVRRHEVAAIFDWDTVSMAGPGADLGWWRFMDGPASALPGIGTADELVQRWQDLHRPGRDRPRVLRRVHVVPARRDPDAPVRPDGRRRHRSPPDVAEQQARNSGPVQAPRRPTSSGSSADHVDGEEALDLGAVGFERGGLRDRLDPADHHGHGVGRHTVADPGGEVVEVGRTRRLVEHHHRCRAPGRGARRAGRRRTPPSPPGVRGAPAPPR